MHELFNRTELKYGMNDSGIPFSDKELDVLIGLIDRSKDGFIQYDKFMRGLLGPMNAGHVSVVKMAFDLLDSDKSGIITIEDHGTSFHPKVQIGEMTHEEAVMEFASQWDTIDKDGKITCDE